MWYGISSWLPLPKLLSWCSIFGWNLQVANFQTSGCDLTHWGRETHICVGKLTIIASDNGLSPGRRQAIIWTDAGILLIGPLGTNFNEILIEIHTFLFKKMRLKMSSAKWRSFCLGLNVLKIGHQDSNPSNGHQSDMSYSLLPNTQLQTTKPKQWIGIKLFS